VCTSSCPTQNHLTWGDCLKAKNVKIAYCRSAAGSDYTQQKTWDKELGAYESARREGIQPRGTSRYFIDDAKRRSDDDGNAFDAGGA